MKEILLTLLLSYSAMGAYPQYRIGDTVQLKTGRSSNHYFNRCPITGVIQGYEFLQKGLKCQYRYQLIFSCTHHNEEGKPVTKELIEYYCDGSLKLVKEAR